MAIPDPPSPVVTVFRSVLRPGVADEYEPVAARMEQLARGMPGFLDLKTFTAEDGERVTIAVFADEDAQQGWRTHPEHQAAQRLGRQRFYERFTVQVCRQQRAWGSDP